ncbi:hypothetical protein [Cohnella herbarum]|uniref:Uncharacterized protein n=1 Tax=Cohnella herbarum TaxID=2728023 RepID=A0A7Z2VN55_9BACL|nr:hypothetical protein [Cohnella herbarum]QJD85990.1 hypothetical protein HH215_24310 [Cohnella herbarum]
MNKNSAIVVCLILSIAVNAFLLKMYFDHKSNQAALEKGILMNEYIDRGKELGYFRAFVNELAAKEGEHLPISEEQSNLYWILAVPGESIIMDFAYEVKADYELYDDYLEIIQQFDREYKEIVNQFKLKLPKMNKEKLVALGQHLDETYDLFIGKALRDWKISRTGKKLDIRFQPPKEILNQGIQELKLIREELQALE